MTELGELYSKNRKEVVACLDMDEWKHSWHNELKSPEDHLKAQLIIQEKMKDRLKDLQKLSESLDTVTQWVNGEF
jgi:hypothetical protein